MNSEIMALVVVIAVVTAVIRGLYDLFYNDKTIRIKVVTVSILCGMVSGIVILATEHPFGVLVALAMAFVCLLGIIGAICIPSRDMDK